MQKTLSIFLSVLMLLSSSGIAFSQHFCGEMEMASEITLGKKDLSCGMEDYTDSPCTNTHLTEDHCCQNQFTSVQTDDNFAKASWDMKFQKLFFVAFVSEFILPEVEITSIQKKSFADYDPPLLKQDLNILYDTFLI